MNDFLKVFNKKFVNGSVTHRNKIDGLFVVNDTDNDKFNSLLERIDRKERDDRHVCTIK